MKKITISVNEKLKLNSKSKNNQQEYSFFPKNINELRDIITDKIKEKGLGTKKEPLNLNDIDISNIDNLFYLSMWDIQNIEYIDISEWNTENIKSFGMMFAYCKQLKYIGDISNWNIKSVEDMGKMFFKCENLTDVGDLNKWDISKSKIDTSDNSLSTKKPFRNMFFKCKIKKPSWYKV